MDNETLARELKRNEDERLALHRRHVEDIEDDILCIDDDDPQALVYLVRLVKARCRLNAAERLTAHALQEELQRLWPNTPA